MTKWHAHVAHMAKHTNMVGALGPGPLPPPKSDAGKDTDRICGRV